MIKKIKVPKKGKHFNNNATHCVGTGRLGLALQAEYIEHLKLVQKNINFKYIRGHGIFSDDIGISRETTFNGEKKYYYNFTYLDRIIDTYLDNNIRPFLEFGFMPNNLKSGDQTIFYWKGNVTPPNSIEKWQDLVEKTINHLIERYGEHEVINWPIEIWNEPNIGFWSGSMEEYFELYKHTAKIIKKVNKNIKVGGPAICGVETEKWLRGFFEFCINNNVPLDFITRHCYTANEPTEKGHYVYHTLNKPTKMIDELKETRDIMSDYSEIANMELHITEFNSSYSPKCPVHDLDYNAAYIARILSEAGDYANSYSYWTFSDVFEEMDVPISVFHGGFGLVALNSIKKPTFYTFDFFSKAGDELLYRDENIVITKDNDKYIVIGWNYGTIKSSDKCVYNLFLPSFYERAMFIKKDVGGQHGNPVNTWSNMGKPKHLNKEMVNRLKASAEPLQSDKKLFAKDGFYEIEFEILKNHIAMLEVFPVKDMTDNYLGYEPEHMFNYE